jgi:hypothetical protein
MNNFSGHNSNFNLNTNHPLIPNSQEYAYYKKYISIHSEDRDILKFPSSSSFEIELPEDLTNVVTIRLSTWAFPANYNVFSVSNNNVSMTFKINNPYNPSGALGPLQDGIYQALSAMSNTNYELNIQEGFFNPTQMTTELTNKFSNSSVASFSVPWNKLFFESVIAFSIDQ